METLAREFDGLQTMVVEDDPLVRLMVVGILEGENLPVVNFSTADEALTALEKNRFGVVVSDIRMPGMSGLDFLNKIHQWDPGLPVILISGNAEVGCAIEAIRRGSFDFLTKPFPPIELVKSVKKAYERRRLQLHAENYRQELERELLARTQEVEAASREMILRLMAAAEYRDDETGSHIRRIGLYSRILAEKLGFNAERVQQVSLAAAMHDLGKIGIPDSILLKPGPLSSEETRTMQTHTRIGHHILSGSSHPLIQMAASIALSHHERWNGTGYPLGLRGENIPIEGRIVMLADHYDALRSKRPYKPGFDHDKAIRIILKGDERTHPQFFDPALLRIFNESAAELEGIFRINQKNELSQAGLPANH